MTPRSLLREHLKRFKPYVAGKPIEDVRREYGLTGRIAKLASNENPLGVSPLARAAMQDAVGDIWLYPDDQAVHFRKKIADRFGVGLENVATGAGSVELLELLATTFLTPDDNIVTSEKTFAVYELSAQKANAVVKLAEMIDGGYRYDTKALAALVDAKTKILYLANPTNPTGTWFTKDEFAELMAKVPEDVLVVYDAAYEEYITTDDMPRPLDYLAAGRRILYLRTFSKAYGMAGIRVGYGIGPKDIIDGLIVSRTSFTTNLLAQVGASAALDDSEFVAKSRDFNKKELDFLRAGLAKLPVVVPPSQTNFLLIDTQKPAPWLFEELQKVGVIVRPMHGYKMPNAIRVSSGLHEDNERFLHHLGILLAQ